MMIDQVLLTEEHHVTASTLICQLDVGRCFRGSLLAQLWFGVCIRWTLPHGHLLVLYVLLTLFCQLNAIEEAL